MEIVIDDLSEDKAFELEIELIKKIGLRIKGNGTLVNMTEGGEGCSGRIPWNKGKKLPAFSDEWRANISKAMKGKIPSKGMIGLNHSDETKEKMIASSSRKEIIDTETGEIFISIRKASEKTGIKRTTLNAQLKGQNPNTTTLIYLYNE